MSWQGDDDVEMDRDDNRARGDRSLSEPGGASFEHVQLSDAPRVCAVKAVGTGVEFRHRIGGTAATDERPPELREQGQMTWIERKQGMDCGAPGRDREEIRAGWVRRTPMCLVTRGPEKWKNNRL